MNGFDLHQLYAELKGNATELKYPGYVVSSSSVFSLDYLDCNGVALLGGGYVGLSHFCVKRRPPGYIGKMLCELREASKCESVESVLFGGDTDHFKLNLKELEELKVPVMNQFIGKLDDGQVTEYGGERWNTKNVVVSPKNKIVLLHVHARKLHAEETIQLSPTADIRMVAPDIAQVIEQRIQPRIKT